MCGNVVEQDKFVSGSNDLAERMACLLQTNFTLKALIDPELQLLMEVLETPTCSS